MNKESSAANILRPLFTVFMVFTVLGASVILVNKYTTFNLSCWKKAFFQSDMRGMFIEEVIVGEDYLKELDIDTEKLADDMMDFMVDDLFSIISDRKARLDRDRFDDFFDEYIEDYYRADGYTRAMIEEQRDEDWEDYQNMFYELRNEYDDSGFYDVTDSVNTVTSSIAIVCIALTVIMIVVLVTVHRDKALPVKNTGIAVTIAEGISLLGALGLGGLIGQAIREEISDTMDYAIFDFVKKVYTSSVLWFVILFVSGVALIVIGSVLSANMRSVTDEYDE